MLIPDPKQRGILVVDDDWGPREALRYILKSRAYVNAHFARNGQEALEKMEALGPDIYLILLDIRMPVMDGMTFLRRLATDCKHPVGIIAETGFPSPEGQEAFEKAGSPCVLPLDYIAKPFEMDDILKSIDTALERVHTERATLPGS